MERRIEFLDWLRAVAVLLVMVGHASPSTAPGGAVGVSMFFVISGYLICSILLRDGMLTIPNVARFWIRRVARIYPMYVVQILILLLWLYRSDADRLLIAIPQLLTFTFRFDVWFGYSLGVLWSLAVEFWFYVTFPAILLIALKTRYPIFCMCVLIAGSIAARLGKTESLTLAYYHQFLIGAVIALWAFAHRIPKLLGKDFAFNLALAILALCVAIPITSRNLGGYFQGSSAALATAVLICYWLSRPPQTSMPILKGIGVISYSAYLLHPIVIDYVWKAKQQLPSHIPTFVAITLGVSLLTYLIVERPFVAMAHKYTTFGKKEIRQVGDQREDTPAII